MPKLIDIPGVGEIEFPDDMPDDQIAAEADRLAGESQPQKSVGGFLSNMAGEVAAAPGALMDMVASAPQAAWTLLKASGYRGGGAGSPNLESAQQVGDVVKAIPGVYADKYGSPQKALDTAYEAPLSTLMDLSALAGGAGGALRAAGSAAKVPGLVRAGAAVGRASELVDPVRGAASAVATAGNAVRPATPTLQRWGTNWMQSAMKTAKTIEDSNVQDVAETAARLRIMPTAEGFDANARELKGLVKAVNAKAREAAQQGRTLDPQAIVRQMDRQVGVIGAKDPTPGRFQEALRGARDEFWQRNSTPATIAPTRTGTSFTPGGDPSTAAIPVAVPNGPRAAKPLSVKRSMRMTERLNERIPFQKQGGMAMNRAETPANEADDALRRAIRAERERAAPGINELNRQRGERLAVQKQLANYTLRREGNLDPIPARALLGGGMAAGLAAGGAPVGAVAGGTLVPWVMNSPAFKGKMGIRLYHGDKVLEGAGRDLRRAATATSRAGVASDALREALLQAMTGDQQP